MAEERAVVRRRERGLAGLDYAHGVPFERSS